MPDSVLDLGLVGGQVASSIDFSADALFCDIMKRTRNLSLPIGDPYQYAEASYVLKVASLTRSSSTGKTTVVLSEPAGTVEDSEIRTGFRVVLTCPADSTFDADYASITVIDQSTFTYPNSGADASYAALNETDVAAASIHVVAVGAAGHPIEDFYCRLSTHPGGGTIPDLNGTYNGSLPGGLPTNIVVSGGATLSNYTPGGGDSTFTITLDSADTTEFGIEFVGVPTDGSFRLPVIRRSDHSTGIVRPDFAQFLSRYKVLRFMDLGRTNQNAYIKSWTKRPMVACGLGLPLEDMIAVCNELEVDMWYCFPQWASDEYVTEAATLIKNTLNPGLSCYFERTNEHWNEGTFSHLGWDLAVIRKELLGKVCKTPLRALAGAVIEAEGRRMRAGVQF